ncbi:hypothetical protein BKI52_01085 [marine bacterium AO1-C]|nr:hypothetical protein BKI52_01085 [marine bacterium AO1-C]
MNSLVIAKEKYTPGVLFNTATNIFKISGESYSEDAFVFYGILLNWVDEYLRINDRPITLNFHFTYFNTSSSEAIFQLLDRLDKFARNKKKAVEVNWHVQDGDPDMIEDGKYYRDNFDALFFHIFS